MSTLNLKRTDKGWEEDHYPQGGGVVRTVSWERLEELLRRTGQLRPNESIERVVVEPHGARLYLETE